MYTSVISPQGQTTIPAPLRKKLGLKPKLVINWQIANDDAGIEYLKITAPSIQAIIALRGIAGNYYQKYQGGEKYLQAERSAWEKSI